MPFLIGLKGLPGCKHFKVATMTDQLGFPMADAVLNAYCNGEEDEALNPLVLVDRSKKPIGRIRDGDYVIFYDIRGEREIQLTQSLTESRFEHFDNHGLKTQFVTMIEYDKKLDTQVAFPPSGPPKNTLVEAVTLTGKTVLKIVETEKAVHLGYFLNGKREEPFPGEERRFVHSLKVADYAQHPRMRLDEVQQTVIDALQEDAHDLLVVNFANVDVIGHIENKTAVLAAVEAVDAAVGNVTAAALRKGRDVLITADHGTVEKWLYPDGKVDTGHTDSPVPFIYARAAHGKSAAPALRSGGALTDVAPTVLDTLGISRPSEMTGASLLETAGRKTSKTGGARKALLLIADGWGYREPGEGNLIALARTPSMDRLMREHPWTLLHASGEAVGMPAGTVGNSESGHLHIGAGRVMYSDRLRIDRSLEDGSFFKNPAFLWAIEGARKDRKALHLLGIVSFYSSHGSLKHLLALMKMAHDAGLRGVYAHSLLGRRGERPGAGAAYIRDVEQEAERLGGIGRVVTVMGRYWALDREFNWDRIEKTFRALVDGVGVPVGG